MGCSWQSKCLNCLKYLLRCSFKHGCLDFIRTAIDRELDSSSSSPNQQIFEKMISGKNEKKEARDFNEIGIAYV